MSKGYPIDTEKLGELIAAGLSAGLISPSEPDRNLEPSNVTDGLCAIARAINKLATAVEGLAKLEARDDDP